MTPIQEIKDNKINQEKEEKPTVVKTSVSEPVEEVKKTQKVPCMNVVRKLQLFKEESDIEGCNVVDYNIFEPMDYQKMMKQLPRGDSNMDVIDSEFLKYDLRTLFHKNNYRGVTLHMKSKSLNKNLSICAESGDPCDKFVFNEQSLGA